jgi:hypothetical protein
MSTKERGESTMTRDEHMKWCKRRAFALVETSDLAHTFGRLMCDLNNHPETQGCTGITRGLTLMMTGHLDTQAEMRAFIIGLD